ncbi:unnamed protein product, partial [Iphiclides podalirius]
MVKAPECGVAGWRGGGDWFHARGTQLLKSTLGSGMDYTSRSCRRQGRAVIARRLACAYAAPASPLEGVIGTLGSAGMLAPYLHGYIQSNMSFSNGKDMVEAN